MEYSPKISFCAQRNKQMRTRGCTLHSGLFILICPGVVRHEVKWSRRGFHKEGIELQSRKSSWPFFWMSGWRRNRAFLAEKCKKFLCHPRENSICGFRRLPATVSVLPIIRHSVMRKCFSREAHCGMRTTDSSVAPLHCPAVWQSGTFCKSTRQDRPNGLFRNNEGNVEALQVD